MDLGLQGLKVIVTGGARGIGRAALEIFAREGCDIAFFSRGAGTVAAAVESLSKHGGKVFGESFDMNHADGFQPWLVRAAEALGGCDIFIHGASSSGSQLANDWDASFQFDLMGTVKGCEALEPYLAASQHASVVVMASTAATETFLAPMAFNAIKASLLTYSKQLSQLWGPKGIRVNAVSPGPIYFEGGNWDTAKTTAPEFYQATLDQMVLGRFGLAEDVAKTLVFLSSPAASYTTGTNVVVDGGYTKRVQF